MGCDIHLIAQARDQNGEWVNIDFGGDREAPFEWRNYEAFGFLAGVRNYSAVTPISTPRGLPDGFSYDEAIDYLGDHSFSWLLVDELTAQDYDAVIEDRRIANGKTCEPGQGEMTTLREHLGTQFFDDLKRLQDAGAERIVFGFDS